MIWAIYGGSFNPPHTGHVQTIGWLLQLREVTGVHVIVTGRPPHKTIDGNDPLKRVEFTRAVVDEHFNENVVVDDHEAKLETTGYTIDNLRRLKELYPERKWAFVMGLDSFLEIQTWREWRSMAGFCEVWVVPRQTKTGDVPVWGPVSLLDYDRFNLEFKGMVPAAHMQTVSPPLTVRFLNRVPVAVASRDLRAALTAGDTTGTDGLIPPPLDEDKSFYAWYNRH